MTDWRANLVDDDAGLTTILKEARTVAVLGAKPGPSEPAHYVPAYLREHGYRIRPVNPRFAGQRLPDAVTVAGLDALTEEADLIEVFRRPEYLVGLDRLAELGAHLLEARQQRAGLRDPLLDVAADILLGIELRFLGKVADLETGGGKRLAEEVLVDARHDAEQRRLAGAVGAVKEREIDAAQDLPLRRDHLAQVLHDERVFAGHG